MGLFDAITNAFGGLLGETDAQFQQKQSNNLSQANQKQAQSLNGEASNYRQAASPVFGGLANSGLGLLGNATTQGNGLLNNYLGSTDANASDPYALNGSQQTELNSQLSEIAQRHQSAANQYQAAAAARGITDPLALQAGLANLSTNFDALAQNHSAAFTEQANQDRQKAQQNALSYFMQQQQLGTSQIGEGAQGLAGLGAQASNSANALAGQATQQTQLANQAAAQNASNFGGLLNLAGYGLGGGFSNLFGGNAQGSDMPEQGGIAGIAPNLAGPNTGTGGAGLTTPNISWLSTLNTPWGGPF